MQCVLGSDSDKSYDERNSDLCVVGAWSGRQKEPYAVRNVEESPPFLEKSGIMLFPRHGRVYHGGSVVHSLESPVILEKGDRLSMMINSEHTLLTFYHARHGFRHEVGQMNLTSLKGWDHTAYSAKKLRWAVTLGGYTLLQNHAG